MISRCLAMSGLFCLLVSSGTFTANALRAETVNAEAVYEIRWSGLAIGEVRMHLNDQEEQRRFRLETATAGVLDWVFTYRSTLDSIAERKDGQVVQTSFMAHRVLDDEDESWSLLFGADGQIKESNIPGEVTADREPVPPSLQRGPDPLTLAIDVFKNLAPGDNIQQTTYDGKRALRLDLACDMTQENKAPLEDMEPEPATVCTIGGELLAGASKRWKDEEAERDKDQKDEDRRVRVWFNERLIEGHQLPVLAHAENRYGLVVARLVSIRAGSGS